MKGKKNIEEIFAERGIEIKRGLIDHACQNHEESNGQL